MLVVVKSYFKYIKAVSLAVGLCLVQPSFAFDAQTVQQMHTDIGNMVAEVGQMKPQHDDTRKRIELVEAELSALRSRLSLYEDKLVKTQQLMVIQNQLIDGQVLQTPLEDPYADAEPPGKVLVAPRAIAQMNVVQQNILQQELDTVPQALRDALPPVKPQSQAFAPTPKLNTGLVNDGERNLGVTNLLSEGQAVLGSLGNQAPDIMAFNEAKSYFDDEYFQLSERKFNQFIQYYRGSSLISNAYFWLGESYYMRKNYSAAARVFYQGYRTNKKGAKAPDNLFRLASSLLMLGNKSDACAAFYEVNRRYAKSHPRLSDFAVEAQKEQAC